jgi:fatty-acid peroxygenase
MTPTLERARAARARTPPAASAWDCTLRWLADPYRFIGAECRRLDSPVFETRIALQRTLCLSGARAAELFHDGDRFERRGAAPEPVRATLFGTGTVQGLHRGAHRRRKAIFHAVLGPGSIARLVARTRREWEAALPAWYAAGSVSLYRALHPVLAQAACGWAGVELQPREVATRTGQLVALFDSAASGIGAHLRARLMRQRAEDWLASRIVDARTGRRPLPPDSPAAIVAWHREGGALLAPQVAAAELLNLIRPIVATSVYLVFTAHALHRHADWRVLLAAPHDGRSAWSFVQEVRRFYPFVPALVARVRRDFEWQGLRFTAGRRALLDVHGTNLDPAAWDQPHKFQPQRWHERRPNGFAFVPHGGGDVVTGHRCPGEDATGQLMLLALRMFASHLRYDVHAPSMRVQMQRLPALPVGGLVLHRIRPAR